MGTHHSATRRRYKDFVASSELRAELISRYEAGESANWLAEVFNTSPHVVAKVLREAGVTIRTDAFNSYYRYVFTDKLGRDYVMRSSWEVRVAHWLDTQGKRWDYELQSFDIGEGHTYTPDFWIYDTTGHLELIVDVKGRMTEKSQNSIAQFRKMYGLAFEVWGKPELDTKGVLDLPVPATAVFDPKKHYRIPGNRRKQMIEMFEAGEPVKEIASAVDRSENAVYDFLTRSGTKEKARRSTPQSIRDRIVELHQSGVSSPDIATQLDVSKATVWRELKRKGVPLTDRAKYNIAQRSSEIEELRQTGLSARQIAEKLELPQRAVRYELEIMKKEGITV